MNEGLIPRRYAKALYEVALAGGDDKRVYQMMNSLVAAFEAQPALQQAIQNPFVASADKEALLNTAAGASKSDAIFADFLKLLVENKRIDLTRAIAIAYGDIYRKANRIYRVSVVSAMPLGKEENQRLQKLITDHLKGGTMEYSESVDPDLIGGFVVTVDNERIDASISNELKQLRLNLISK